EQVMENNLPTNKFRFHYSISGTPFSAATETAPVTVTLTMTAGAWQDSAGNDSAALTQTIKVRKPAQTFFIELSGGMTLNAAGLLDEPIFDIRGHVLFQAKQEQNGGTRFQLDFDGTFKVIYLGNLASVAGEFIYDSSSDSDSVTVNNL